MSEANLENDKIPDNLDFDTLWDIYEEIIREFDAEDITDETEENDAISGPKSLRGN